MTVRAATLADVEFLVDGNARMALETESLALDRERLRAGVEAVFADAGRGFYLIAEVDGERAGQMMMGCVPRRRIRRHSYSTGE